MRRLLHCVFVLAVVLLAQMVSAGSLKIRVTLPPELNDSPRKYGSLYLTDLNYNAVTKVAPTSADQAFDDLPDVPIAIQAFLSVPGFGDLDFTAANGGSGYLPNGQTIEMWYEFARHRFLAAEKMIINAHGKGFEVPQAIQAELEKARVFIKMAESHTPGSGEQSGFALKSLQLSCPASEKLLIALGSERLDKQDGLRPDQLISTWALPEPGEGQKWRDAANPLFNCLVPTWYWQSIMQADGSYDWHYRGYMQKIVDGGTDSTNWAATVQAALEKAEKSGKVYPDWDQVAHYNRLLAMGKTIRTTPGMWLNCLPLWYGEPTFENLKDISVRFAGALAKKFPKVTYWQATSETAYSWGNMGFLEPEQIIDMTRAVCQEIKSVNPQANCGINNIIFVGGDAAIHYGKKSPRIVGTHKYYEMCVEAGVPFDFIILQLYFAGRTSQLQGLAQRLSRTNTK